MEEVKREPLYVAFDSDILGYLADMHDYITKNLAIDFGDPRKKI